MKVLTPYYSCLVTAPLESDTGPSEIDLAVQEGYQQIYIMSPAGLYRQDQLIPGKDGQPRFVRMKVTEIPRVKFAACEQAVEFLPDGKVPMELFYQIKAFFREVIKKKGTAVEAMIWVLWSQEQGYFLHVPSQSVSHASATYDWAGIPSGAIVVVDIHSHADFGAFFSSTDDRDDSNCTRFSVVVGDNTKPKVSVKSRFSHMGTRVDLELEHIFSAEEPDYTIPAEWINQVADRPPALQHGRFSHLTGMGAGAAGVGWTHPQSSNKWTTPSTLRVPPSFGPDGRKLSKKAMARMAAKGK